MCGSSNLASNVRSQEDRFLLRQVRQRGDRVIGETFNEWLLGE